MPLAPLIRQLRLQTMQQILHILAREANTEGGEVEVVIVGGSNEVGEGVGLLGGKGAWCHCHAAKHGADIKMRKGPQIINGVHKSSMGQTWVFVPRGSWKNPCPTSWRHASTISCTRFWAAEILLYPGAGLAATKPKKSTLNSRIHPTCSHGGKFAPQNLVALCSQLVA